MCSTGQLARKYPSFPLPAEQSARRKNVAATFVKSKKTYTFATASETDDALFMIVHILAEIAQLVEHNLAKVGVASSSLVFRSLFRWRQCDALLKHSRRFTLHLDSVE